jgi:hypothetical protein
MARGDHLAKVLWAYPKSYRERRGEEILGTLHEAAPSRGAVESLRVCLDLLRHGLRLRFGISSEQAPGRVLATAALPGMTMAAAVAGVLPVYGQLIPGVRHTMADYGPATAIWPALFALWVLGGVVAIAAPGRKRIVAATCIAVTVGSAVLLPPSVILFPLSSMGLLPAFWLLAALAVPAVVAPRGGSRRSNRPFALFVGALVALLLVASCSLSYLEPSGFGLYVEFSRFAIYVAASTVFGSLVLLSARKWTLGAASALLAVPWFLFAALERGPLGVSSSMAVGSLAIAAVIGAGLIGSWLVSLRSARLAR